METTGNKSILRGALCVFMSFVLAFSMIPSTAMAQVGTADSQAVEEMQAVSEAQAVTQADLAQLATQASAEELVSSASGLLQADPGEDLSLEAEAEESKDIAVTVGFPSESNVKKDLAVSLTYNDKFFADSSATYNNDLAYASVCLAAAADNSNEGGSNYALKSKNVVSFLQQIGCNDVTANDGYNYKPMAKANIGVAIGYKDIMVGDKKYRLFVFGIRGGGYEEEWAVNMRVGTEGDATGFQEARDGALGFIMPYIKKHTEDLEGDVNVKVWGSGYCRGGTTTNMVFGWLNKWVYERNNGHTYNNLEYAQNYNAQHEVYGADYKEANDNYDASTAKYTTLVSFDPSTYIGSNVKFTNNDLYAYPVNCPTASDGADVKNYEGLMTGIHNLINPDDWFPQVIMSWWGFNRYGYSQDHDITGTYKNDGELSKRNKAVWDPSNIGGRLDAVNDMIKRLKAVDPDTAFNSTYFRQYYFSKASVVTNTIKKVGGSIWNRIKRIFGAKEDKLPDIFQISVDEKGEGNQYVSKGVELKYNQGAYYEEFLRFVLDCAGVSGDAAAQRKQYVDKYELAFVYLMDWVCGQPLEVREKFGKTASSNIKKAFEDISAGNSERWNDNNTFFRSLAPVAKNPFGRILYYLVAAGWAVTGSDSALIDALIIGDLDLTLNDLKVQHTKAQLDKVGRALGPIVLNVYIKEQSIGALNFYHAFTLYKAGSSVAQSHWPEQSLAWFSQCKPAQSATTPKSTLKSQAAENGLTAQDDSGAVVTEHTVYAYYPEDSDVLYTEGTRENGDVIGVIATPEELNYEQYVIESWNVYSLTDILEGNAKPLRTGVFETDTISASDPAEIVLVPNFATLESKHVNLWLNKAMTGFDQDVKIGEFDVVDGGYYAINYSGLPEEDISEEEYKALCEGTDVLYYGDNDNLPSLDGVMLYCWSTAVESEEDEVFVCEADDTLDYDNLPEGDTVDLYATWIDPVAYGVTYHANRSDSDEYAFQDAQYAADDGTLEIEGFDEGDEGLQNEGKTLVGWNTKADGSGTMYSVGDTATTEDLGLGTREQYLQDLEELADLEEEEFLLDDEEGTTSDADKFEAELEAKYTVNLYAQWEETEENPPTKIAMHRLYNPNSGEHFYTADVTEKDNLVGVGWTYEGIGWYAPVTSTTPVLRLYNQNGGEHHYCMEIEEAGSLIKAGWTFEGIGWYSDDAKTVPLYRDYNPNAFANNHNYTTSLEEHFALTVAGWTYEGYAWYGVN